MPALDYPDLASSLRAPARLLRPAEPTERPVLAWLPFLWNRVLFPGTAPTARPLRWRALVLLTLLAGALLYPCLSFHLFEPDEGRYAQIPFEMLERGELVVPTLQGQPYLDKPPLFYWLVMASYSLFGYHAWAAQLVPALAVHLGVLATYLLGRRLVGERSAFWGALLLIVAPAYLGMGRLLVLDGLLTLWVTLSLLCAYLAQRETTLRCGWWLSAALCCGLGVLTKGPVALVLLLIPLVVHRRLMADVAPIRRRDWLAFAGIVLALTLPWYVAVCCTLPEFARHFFWQHNVLRFMQPFDHLEPVWFFIPILLGGMLPALLLVRLWGRFLLTDDPASVRRRCPEIGFLVLAGGWCVLFFSLSGSKLPTYILPAWPPLCLAFGHCLAHGDGRHGRTVPLVLGGSGLLLAGLHFGFVPWLAETRSPLNRADDVRACCADSSIPVVCFPRNVDSVSFAMGRADFQSFRTKQLGQLLDVLDRHPRVVILFSHFHSSETVMKRLPPHLRVARHQPLGLCDLAVIERIASDPENVQVHARDAEDGPDHETSVDQPDD